MTGPAAIQTDTCEPWTTAAAAADCCATVGDTDLAILEAAAGEASDLLYQLSGRRYPGLCERTVRPCSRTCSCFQVLSRGHIVAPDWPDGLGWGGSCWNLGAGRQCGCRPLSQITLAGHPVREIVEVTIDGQTVDAAGYRLDRRRHLVRLAEADGKPQRWPGCQNLDVDEGPGTFFVTYLYGLEPPASGVQAANQLACELAKACAPETAGECDLPPGTVRITRLGITVDAQALGLWLLGSQRTGLAQVDAFLAVYGRKRRRPAAIYTPELDPFPLPVD